MTWVGSSASDADWQELYIKSDCPRNPPVIERAQPCLELHDETKVVKFSPNIDSFG